MPGDVLPDSFNRSRFRRRDPHLILRVCADRGRLPIDVP
jgi:hypothetical protein